MSGQQLLIVDSRETDREGLKKLFEDLGYHTSTTGSGTEARDLVGRRFFPVALVDMDTGGPGAGLDVIRRIQEISRPTTIVMLTGRRSFEGAVDAIRLGVRDVVFKRPEQIGRLRDVVAAACDVAKAEDTSGSDVLRETAAVLDDAFRIMLDMGRRMHHDVSMARGEFRPKILIIDGEQDFLEELAEGIQQKNWSFAASMSGGDGLDKAVRSRFDLVAARMELMDLRGSMVLKTIQAQNPETIGIVYSLAGDGHLGVFKEGRMDDGERPFLGPKHLIEKMETIVNELATTRRDRKVIQAFRAANEPFFRRYAQLKLRLGRILD